MYQKDNQAMGMYPLFFDPIYKSVFFSEKNGKRSIHYEDSLQPVCVDGENVIFTIYAPNAQTVEVAGISGSMKSDKIALIKDEKGIFSKSITGIDDGFHYLRWYVDGVQIVNPYAPVTYGCFGAFNFFEKTKEKDAYWFLKDVPHGQVEMGTYLSHVNGRIKNCYIYTPPTYYQEPNKKYPVLYLQHGVGESETGWIWNGKANLILDNLIADNKCSEMIVVMCSGYSFKENEDPVFYPGDFGKELVYDCIPYIEHKYRVKKGRGNRAMAGLSLGSGQATQIVSRFQNLFAYLGVFSGIRDTEMETILNQNSEEPMDLIFLSAGVFENNLCEKQKKYEQILIEHQIPYQIRQYPGYHEWHAWRDSLHDFVMSIFTDDKAEVDDTDSYELPTYDGTEKLRMLLKSHMIMSDPLHKDLILLVDEKGNPAGKYADAPEGIELIKEHPGSVKFRIRAVEAKTVSVRIWGSEPIDLIQEENGWWSVIAENIEPGFHYYHYLINGTPAVDGNARVGYGGFQAVNYFELPESEYINLYTPCEEAGTIHMNYYHSKRMNREKVCYVYTPYSYDRNMDIKYPVLYLQHGGGENETGWVWHGKVANIADHLIREKKMKEMIIVMTTGYDFPIISEYHQGLSAFIDDFTDSCIPFIDKTYRTIADRENRAMAGLSMGGLQTQKITFHHPELFSSVGIFSGGLVIKDNEDDYSAVLLNPEAFKKQFDLLFVACGTEENFYGTIKNNAEQISEKGVPIETYFDYGYHDWTFWRHCIKEFLPKLF